MEGGGGPDRAGGHGVRGGGADSVSDPDGRGWWDPDLDPGQVERRIKGLAGCIDEAAARGAPKEWLEAERSILARLRLRAAQAAKAD